MLILSFLMLSLSAFADQSATINAADPQYCGRASTCVKGYVPLLREGTYYARATGRNCDDAMNRAEEVFVRKFGNMSCGLISGPHLDNWSCRRDNGRIIAWLKCNPDSEVRSRPRPRCALVGGVLVC